jgi:hypothetical protein
MSSGLRRTSKIKGPIITSTSRPMAEHDARQPLCRMIVSSHGSMTVPPTPAPANAMLIARPRRRANQLCRNAECAV